MTNSLAFDSMRRSAPVYQEACILAAAGELDFSTTILENDNRLTAGQVAQRHETDLRGTTALLDALAAIGFLEKSGTDEQAVYSVVESYRELLDSRHPNTFVPMLRHMACYQRRWTQLSWAVKEGKPPVPQGSFLGEEEDRRSFIMGMNSVARALVGPTVESLRSAGVLSFGKTPIRFIDIGGASGTYTQAFLEALPESEGTVFDLPVGIEAARKRFVGSPFESRVRLIEGDFYRDEFPTGYDFAWISAIIHQQGRKESREMYEKTFHALLPGGKVAIRDFMMEPNRIKPKEGAFFGINMLVGTKTGMVYTFEEVKEDLQAAGFVDVELAVPAETMSAVAVGRKA